MYIHTRCNEGTGTCIYMYIYILMRRRWELSDTYTAVYIHTHAYTLGVMKGLVYMHVDEYKHTDTYMYT